MDAAVLVEAQVAVGGLTGARAGAGVVTDIRRMTLRVTRPVNGQRKRGS